MEMRYGIETIKMRGYEVIEGTKYILVLNRRDKTRRLVIPLDSDKKCILHNPNKTLERIAQKLDQIPLKGIAPITVYFS